MPTREELLAEIASQPDDAYYSDRHAAAISAPRRQVLANLRSQETRPAVRSHGRSLIRYRLGTLGPDVAMRRLTASGRSRARAGSVRSADPFNTVAAEKVLFGALPKRAENPSWPR